MKNVIDWDFISKQLGENDIIGNNNLSLSFAKTLAFHTIFSH